METNPFRAARRASQSGHGDGDTPSRPDPGGGGLRRWVAERVAGRRWVFRAPLLLILLWVLRGYLMDAGGGSIFSGITLGFHEMGHAFFGWFGNRILTAAGGTIFQLLVPLGAGAYLALKQRDPFGAAVCLFWLGTALVEAGVYAADARAQALPLVSPFGPVDVDSHDWTVVLMKFGKLSRDQQIGGFLVGLGRLVMVGSMFGAAWVLRVMAMTPAAGPRETDEA